MTNASTHTTGTATRDIVPTVSVSSQDVRAGEQIIRLTTNKATSVSETTTKDLPVFADIIQSPADAQLQTR